MNVSIIDIGTQSLKHYIFTIEGQEKKLLFYKRHSDAHLGNNDEITTDAIDRNIRILQECLRRNEKESVTKLKLLGTDILRKAAHADTFLQKVKEIAGQEIQVISQEQEAIYLYEGFISIVPGSFRFAALNIGGGSTEVVLGDAKHREAFINLPFGVKFLRNEFVKGGQTDWRALDDYLEEAVVVESSVDNVFITGALDFISAAGPALGVQLQQTAIPHHPLNLSIDTYRAYINVLRGTAVGTLKKLYPQDPGFCDNLALGQSVYLAIAKKLAAKKVIPSRNDLTDGVIYRMLNTEGVD
jgi:exopolyphosphatase/guanosine-5'-triphosphate,3'-diphosphate pyrophosphatase